MNKFHSMTLALLTGASLLVTLQPLAAHASPGVRDEIRADMADARREVRVEMAQARADLDKENLSLGDGLHFGKHSSRRDARKDDVANAEISPAGDFLIDGKIQAIDARQRRQLLAYRLQVIDLAKLGIDAGERAAMAALEATDVSLFRLIVGGLSGSLERRVEATVMQHIKPMVQQLCRRLPKVYDSQQQLAASLPQFRPYATLERDDIEDCEHDFSTELAAR